MLYPICDQHAIAAGSSSAPSSNTELDKSATKVGIDQALLGTNDRLSQARIVDSFTSGIARKPFRLKDPHKSDYNTINYSSNNHISAERPGSRSPPRKTRGAKPRVSSQNRLHLENARKESFHCRRTLAHSSALGKHYGRQGHHRGVGVGQHFVNHTVAGDGGKG